MHTYLNIYIYIFTYLFIFDLSIYLCVIRFDGSILDIIHIQHFKPINDNGGMNGGHMFVGISCRARGDHRFCRRFRWLFIILLQSMVVLSQTLHGAGEFTYITGSFISSMLVNLQKYCMEQMGM